MKRSTQPKPFRGYPIGFLNPAIPIKISLSSRNPERFHRPFPIPVISIDHITSQQDVQISSSITITVG